MEKRQSHPEFILILIVVIIGLVGLFVFGDLYFPSNVVDLNDSLVHGIIAKYNPDNSIQYSVELSNDIRLNDKDFGEYQFDAFVVDSHGQVDEKHYAVYGTLILSKYDFYYTCSAEVLHYYKYDRDNANAGAYTDWSIEYDKPVQVKTSTG